MRSLSKKPGYQRQNDAQHDTEDNHGGQRGIKAKARPLDSDVAGQVAQPAQFIAGEPQHEANDNQQQTKPNDYFT